MASKSKSNFLKRKLVVLAKIKKGVDKSMKGSIDAPISSLINNINQSSDFFTLSSCSGRIAVVSQGGGKLKFNNTFLINSHHYIEPRELISAYKSYSQNPSESDLCFRFEPFILALEAMDIFSANKLISVARKVGYKNAFLNLRMDKQNGIDKVIVSIRGSDKIEVMLHKHDFKENGGALLLGEEFLKMLTCDANQKMVKNLAKLEMFETEFVKTFI